MLQDIDFSDPITTRDRKMEVLLEIKNQQELLINHKKKEFINTVILNGVFFGITLCFLIIFDSFFETEIKLKKSSMDAAEELVQIPYRHPSRIKGNQNNKQEAASWQI